jgi:DNA-binding transcriptional ArsR family regulator
MNRVFKALADPTRRRVLQLLRRRPMTAGELAAHFELAKPTMSAHFGALREAGLIEAAKSGTTITYTLKMSVLEDALLGFAETLGIEREATPRAARSKRPARREA